MSVYFTGIQPSGNILHLGNYIGSLLNLKNKIKTASRNDKFIVMVADLHSMTSIHDPAALRKNKINLIATYFACGIQPSKNVFFFTQSAIPAHSELNWILTSICPLGLLERMTQYKDKVSKKKAEDINTGLLCYPILMAGDILLYDSNYVPVGEDQTQHMEFCRDMVNKFNHIYNVDSLFTMPEGLIDKTSKRIMSLGDGKAKMSKSVGTENDKIFLLDTDDAIAKKIKVAKTDSITGIYSDQNRPEVSNLINIFSSISGQSVEEISNIYRDKQTKVFKDDLTQLVISEISPIRENILDYLKNNKDLLIQTIQDGNKRANDIAEKKLTAVKQAVGLL